MAPLRLAAFAAVIALTAVTSGAVVKAAESANVHLEARIPLGQVSGRIDHMAIDLARRRLFVAELGNSTVAVVDLVQGKVVHTIRGLREPQGVAYAAGSERLLVASGGDGSVRAFSHDGGGSYREVGRVNLGSDADNIRLDNAGSRALVGHGGGALAVIDTDTLSNSGDIPLKAHPESFQLSPRSGLVYVNVPRAQEIAVVDPAAGKQIASWRVGNRRNFPMALDESHERVPVVFRDPPLLEAFAVRDGANLARIPTCGDADDLFVDARRQRVYVSCGEGRLDVFAMDDGASFHRLVQLPTSAGARTSLFVSELDRLFVAAPARPPSPATILVFKLD